MQVLLTALDALAPLNLPHVVACYGVIDTPAAIVTGILHSNSCYYRKLDCKKFIMQGDPADPLTAARSLTIW